MKPHLLISTVAGMVLLSVGAFAQTQQQDHQEHHPGGSQAQAQTEPPAPQPAAPQAPPAASAPDQQQMPMGQMMQGMPEQCRAMMQNMPQGCMPMMQQMMQGRMGGSMPGMAPQPATQSAATKAYVEASDRMRGPMMEGLQASNPDVAFVRGMIAHHQGAIDMARVVLQYGNDGQTKKWANDVVREQQREINEMQEWLKKNKR
ncbi:MAG: DUF305 domain-containing protein [Xanthobacteraceae bacterium]|nr:MAG: DUF305 domain-containing protein [Xanthobacteraceae bacterium]